jgi:hypothetical protein
MVSGYHRFGIQDMVAVAVVAGTATLLLRRKLEAFGVRLSPALRQVFLEWWPLLLILAGTILLVAHYSLETTNRRPEKSPHGADWSSASSSATPATTRGTHEY